MKPRIVGDERVLRLHRMHDEARVHEPLAVTLRRLCRAVSDALPADVVSVYLRERSLGDEDMLVMRANVGFTPVAIGNVQLRVGEGITGLAAELGEVVIGDVSHERFAHVEGLQEERFPHLLALPILRHGDVLGVLVVQRAHDDAFDEADMSLAAALVAPFAMALASDRGRHARARDLGSGKEVRLKGKSIVRGKALCRAELLAPFEDGTQIPGGAPVGDAFDAVARRLSQRVERSIESEPELADELRQMGLLLIDDRFRSAIVEETSSRGVVAGLAAVARRYALAPLQTATGKELKWLERRSSEVGGMCRLVLSELQKRPLVRSGGALLLPRPPGGLLCLELGERRPSAVIVADNMSRKSIGARLLTRSVIPTLASVGGLYAWVREGDPIAVDADEGLLHVHPSPEISARMRRA